MLKIIGGQWKGRKLHLPPLPSTRPTSHRHRESIFNILCHRFSLSFEGLKVLDLFAGSGAMGLEALSRGAEGSLFVEANSQAVHTLYKNIGSLISRSPSVALSPHSFSTLSPWACSSENNIPWVTLFPDKLESFLEGPPFPFDLVFMDPPYSAFSHYLPLLDILCQKGWVSPQGIIVAEGPSLEKRDREHLLSPFQKNSSEGLHMRDHRALSSRTHITILQWTP